jgi:hypothetical protein
VGNCCRLDDELVVVGMTADPNPLYAAGRINADGSIMLADAD